MLSLDKVGIERLLLQLEEGEYLDPRYRFYKVNNELNLLGTGGFSYVYEMYDVLDPEKRYAAKVIGASGKSVDSDYILGTTQLQYSLGEQSENILRVIGLWTMKLRLNDEGDLLGITGVNSNEYDEADGSEIQIVFMEKLDSIFSRDKYGNTELLRNELQTEEGVISFAKQVGRALFAVHNNGFLHRDVKLENIFWDKDLQQYKLGDFGIARYVGDGDAETVVFTDGYGAPEIERKLEEGYNAAADIYSFGVTLYLLLNELKFPASDGYHVNFMAQYSPDFIFPAPLHGSEELARIVRKMCNYRSRDRYQSIEEVLMDIGKIDGSFTENGFTEEYEDLATETYKEEVDFSTETYREPKETTDEEKPESEENEEPWWNKPEDELTREERKKRAKAYEKDYNSSMIWRMILSAILFFALYKSLEPNFEFVTDWRFWILPVALLIESILLRIKEFHAEFAIVTISLAMFSIFTLGVGVPQVVIILITILGVPSITAGCAIGTGLWIAQMITGRPEWVSFLSKYDLGWIVIILLVWVLQSNAWIRADYNRTTNGRFMIWTWIMDKLGLVMVLSGILLLVLQYFNVFVIPEMLKHIHLIRTGIGIYLVEILYVWLYMGFEEEEQEDDEPMDESGDI